MEQVLDFFRKLFDTSDWPPRWHCGNWTEFHGWFYIVSDLLIWSAYFAIPLAILRYITKRVDAKFVRAYFLFAAFILACGSTHLLDAVTFWFPAYRLNALVRFFTGVISWVTVFYVIRILPTAMALPTQAALENEIAERKKVEDELKVANGQLNIAQEIGGIGHWEWDVAANNVSWSHQMYRMFELPENEPLTYESYLQRVHPDDKDYVAQTVERALANKRYSDFTHRIRTTKGTEKVVQARGEVVLDEDGRVKKMIGTAQDVTEQQKSQQQLIERTQDLENTNAELQKFAYVASHDLQEPLRKILTFASLLDRDEKEALSDRGRLYTDKIVQSAERMQRLIDDILQFSSLKATKDDYREVDLNAVLQQVLSDMEVKIEQSGADVRWQPLPAVEAIPSQMRQLLQNLVSNAIKFRKEGATPVVEITAAVVAGDDLSDYSPAAEGGRSRAAYGYNWSRERFVKIAIKDNGIGFNEALAEKIFEIFQRLHTSAAYEGTGIGLAICKKIADNHHGTIRVDSKPGQGTVFTVILPQSQKNFFVE